MQHECNKKSIGWIVVGALDSVAHASLAMLFLSFLVSFFLFPPSSPQPTGKQASSSRPRCTFLFFPIALFAAVVDISLASQIAPLFLLPFAAHQLYRQRVCRHVTCHQSIGITLQPQWLERNSSASESILGKMAKYGTCLCNI